MGAGRLDITIEQGATFQRTITVTEGASLFDLTGYTARMHIRSTLGAATTLIVLTSENGRLTMGGVAGTIAMLITATDTAALSFDSGVHDIEIVSGSGVVIRLLEGTVTLSREVTR